MAARPKSKRIRTPVRSGLNRRHGDSPGVLSVLIWSRTLESYISVWASPHNSVRVWNNRANDVDGFLKHRGIKSDCHWRSARFLKIITQLGVRLA